MMLFKNILLALTLAFSLNYIVFSLNTNSMVKCDRRPNATECAELVYTPTCGYYKKDCPFDLCGRDVGSTCYACSDETILYYKKGACEEDKIVAQCYDDMCDPKFSGNLERTYEPVCGISRNGKTKQTYDNYCKACNSNDWYQTGACKKDRNICKANDRGKDCSKKNYKPVCAHAKVADNSTQYITVSSGCSACNDKAVDYYLEGECGELLENNTYCLPNSRPSFCTLEYNPVCGFSLNESGILTHQVLSNGCSACADPSVIYWQPGPCIFTCNRSPNIIFECDGATVQPICGTYEENGKAMNVSLKNQCIGCYYAPVPKIDSYVDGLCPGDEGIYCKNDAGGFLQGIISPVCGFTEEGCSDSSCQTSFSEPLFACADNTTLLFKAGLCPGDEGMSCRPFRRGFVNNENESYLSGINYGTVCGYTEMGCNDNTCRETYANQTLACENDEVLYFNKGSCS